MSRKRSISSLLDDLDEESSLSQSSPAAHPRRNRSIASIIGEETASSVRSSSNIRRKVICNCPDCNGKLVDSRTKEIHESAHQEYQGSQSTILAEIQQLEIGEGSASASARRPLEPNEQNSDDDDHRSGRASEPMEHSDDDDDYFIDDSFLFRRRVRRYTTRTTRPVISGGDDGGDGDDPDDNTDDDKTSESSESSEFSTEEDIYSDSLSSDYDVNDEIFEDYSTPHYEPFQPFQPFQRFHPRYLWILLWIMNFRTRFNVTETATEALIKFMKLVLCEVAGDDFNDFPDSLYLARMKLGLRDQFHNFVPCPKCHKLYQNQQVTNFQQEGIPAVMKCQHIEFPNSSHRKSRPCNTPLSQVISANQKKIRPNLIYPFSGIKQQLASMFLRPGFEESLRHWANRSSDENIMTDIYDGNVWKTFKETDDEGSEKFFRNEVADSHIGLMLNLDWFQPYDGTIYSIGVIYAAICNLPRDIRFKRENLLTLGLLPGPSEVSLHRINHYLAPIIDELKSLWDGITLNRTYECQGGKNIRAALILVSCDVPAARKICGHVSALVSCHICEKKANYENRQHNFAGMDNMEEWFIARDPTRHRQNAHAWRQCNSDASRRRVVKQTGVRWSELLRLPYFNPVRFITVDPMHCLFLGIAKWIVKRIWIDEGVLTTNSLKMVQKKMNEFQIPSDLGRIPGKIHAGEGFSNFTADQWRIFFTIYATVSLWEHLSGVDRQILSHFVRICSLLVSRILELESMQEANERLIEIVKLIEVNYGRDKITPNLHLSLHLHDCSFDYGPLYAFWCFSFERMNGILGK